MLEWINGGAICGNVFRDGNCLFRKLLQLIALETIQNNMWKLVNRRDDVGNIEITATIKFIKCVSCFISVSEGYFAPPSSV
jgi:hypothetical protein